MSILDTCPFRSTFCFDTHTHTHTHTHTQFVSSWLGSILFIFPLIKDWHDDDICLEVFVCETRLQFPDQSRVILIHVYSSLNFVSFIHQCVYCVGGTLRVCLLMNCPFRMAS